MSSSADSNGIAYSLLMRTWWTYSEEPGSLDQAYHWFNLFEGVVWLICSAAVLFRYRLRGRSRMEVVYAIFFVTFALTDFREAWSQQSWLLWLKLINLIVLFRLRRMIMQRFYPDARLL